MRAMCLAADRPHRPPMAQLTDPPRTARSDAGLTAARLGLERLRTRIEALRVAHEGRELAFTVSAGLVEVSPDETLVEAIARADRALYQAKQQGRNKVVADARSP